MRDTPITIYIPTPLYQRAKKLAQAQKKDVSEILAAYPGQFDEICHQLRAQVV